MGKGSDGSSVHSMSQASSFAAKTRRFGGPQDGEGSERGDDELTDRRSTLETGVFGVLFTLSKEASEQHIVIRWMVLRVLLDAWQLFITVVNPAFGWDINPESGIWKAVSVPSFTWLGDLSYTWYEALLYAMVGMLAANVALCIWVAYSFKEQKFEYVWPIKVLRLFTSVFFQAFDVASLNLLQIGISCNYTKKGDEYLRLEVFPEYACGARAHVIQAVVSGVSLLIFVATALLLNMAEIEVNPTSRRPRSLGHSAAEVMAFGIKALLTLVGVFIGWRKVAAVLYLVLSLWLAWQYLRWAPHMVAWPNHMKSGVAVSVAYAAALQLLIVFREDLGSLPAGPVTVAMLAGLVPAGVLGAVLSWYLLRHRTEAALLAFSNADPGIKIQDIHPFTDPRDVEIVARCCRVWSDRYTLDKEAVGRAEAFIKAGLALFPTDAFMLLLHANFMMDVMGVAQSGTRRLELAKKQDPSLLCRFVIFVRHQMATQRAVGSTTGGGGNMDLLGYVEYQRKQRMVLRHHKDALNAMANFWKILDASSVSFTTLSKALNSIEMSVSQAETAYRVVLESYSSSPKLIRLYAKFKEGIKNDPWGAAEYYAEAERLEEAQQGDGQGPVLPDGTPLGRMEELSTAVFVCDAAGELQMLNRAAHHMFGYQKGELDGKNITLLMQPHVAAKHAGMMRRFIDANSAGEAAAFVRHIIGLQRDRVAFPVKLSVSRSSGIGEDSIFIGLIEPLHTPHSKCTLWIAPSGVIMCCDANFVSGFGFTPDEVVGSKLRALLRPGAPAASDVDARLGARSLQADAAEWMDEDEDGDELLSRLIGAATKLGVGAGAAEDAPCWVRHKYVAPKVARISVTAIDLGVTPVFEVAVTLVSAEPQLLLVCGRKGVIRHVSGPLAACLGGVKGKGQAGGAKSGASGDSSGDAHTMQDYLPPHWKELGAKYLQDHGRRGVRETPGGAPVFGAALELRSTRGRPRYMRVAASSSDLVGERLDVIHMQAATLETAVAERRLRLHVSTEGLITAVGPGTPASLFGFAPENLIGCRVWECVSLMSTAAAATQAAVETTVMAQKDDLAEQLAAVSGGTGSVLEARRIFDALVRRTLQSAGESWRVGVRSPTAINEVAAIANGDPDMASALLLSRTVPAVMQLNVTLPGNDAAVGCLTPAGEGPAAGQQQKRQPQQIAVTVDLWAAEGLTAIVRVDVRGRIAQIHEEVLRPVGLLFGLPTKALLNEPLSKVVVLGAGKTAAGLLSDGPKSSMKSKAKDANANKVGPLHRLPGVHQDGLPLTITVQVMGKPGPGQPMTAILKIHKPTTGIPGGSGAAVLPAFEVAVRPPSGQQPAVQKWPSVANKEAAGAGKLSSFRAARPSTANINLPDAQQVSLPGSTSVLLPPPPAAPPMLALSMPSPSVTRARVGSVTAGSIAVPADASAMIIGVVGALDGVEGAEAARLRSSSIKLTSSSPRAGAQLRSAAAAGLQGAAAGTPRSTRSPSALQLAKNLEEEGDIGAGSNDGGGSADEGDASDGDDSHGSAKKTLGGQKNERIADWVNTDGETYQNTATGQVPTAAGDDDGSEDDILEGAATAAAGAGSNHGGPAPSAAAGYAGGVKTLLTTAVIGAKAEGPGDNDALSDGGKSAGSGKSGFSAASAAQSAAGADYKRGKRFKKLAKLMDSPQAQKTVLRFKWHALLTVAMLTAVHVVCFALMYQSILAQSDSMSKLTEKGLSQLQIHDMLTDVRSLDQIYKGKSVENLFVPEDAVHFAFHISRHAGLVKKLDNKIVSEEGKSGTIFDTYYYQPFMLWSDWDVSGNDIYENFTLWDATTRMYASAKVVYQNHQVWGAAGVNLSDMVEVSFLLKSGPTIADFYREVLEELMLTAVASTTLVNNLQLIFLVIEGCLCCSVAAGYLVYLLRAVATQRYMLYGTFLTIPLGLTRALVTQNQHLLDEDDGDSDEEEEERKEPDGGRGGDEEEAKPEKRRAAMMVEQEPRATDNSAGGGGGGAQPAVASRRSNRRGSADMRTDLGAALARTESGISGTPGGGCFSWLHQLLPRSLRRRGSVVPLLSQQSSQPVARRTLRRDAKDIYYMLLPLFVWFVLVITLYSLDYAKLQGVGDLVATQAVANYNAARAYRCILVGQELAAEEDPTKVAAWAADLRTAIRRSKDAYYTLSLGKDAYKLLGPDTEMFPHVGAPMTHESPGMVELFYSNKDCLRGEEDPCLEPGHRFYEMSRSGIDTILHQFWFQAENMASDAAAKQQVVGLNSSHFDFMYNIGGLDLTAGNEAAIQEHGLTINNLFADVMSLHILLFVLMFLIFGGFTWGLLLPLLKRMRKEKRRIAELMSQLPLELDVEKLVVVALGTAPGNASGKQANMAAAQQDPAVASRNPSATAGHPTLDTDAVKMWKNVLRTASVSGGMGNAAMANVAAGGKDKRMN